MTAGSVDDHLGSAMELARLLQQYEKLSDYLAEAEDFQPNVDTFDYPFVAGIDFDGTNPGVDRHFNLDWNGLDIRWSLREHECWEWGLRKFAKIGEDYSRQPEGHRFANRAELDEVVRQLYLQKVADSRRAMGEHELWSAYDAFIDPQVKGTESEQITIPSPRLALYPYRGTKLYDRLVALGVTTDQS